MSAATAASAPLEPAGAAAGLCRRIRDLHREWRQISDSWEGKSNREILSALDRREAIEIQMAGIPAQTRQEILMKVEIFIDHAQIDEGGWVRAGQAVGRSLLADVKQALG